MHNNVVQLNSKASMFMRVSGRMEKEQVEENKYGKMELTMKGTGLITWQMDMAGSSIQMATLMKEIGCPTELKAMVIIYLNQGVYSHVCGAVFKGNWKDDKQ